jgi:hypothetical protein
MSTDQVRLGLAFAEIVSGHDASRFSVSLHDAANPAANKIRIRRFSWR